MSTEQDIRTFKEWWLWTMLDPISALDNIPFSSVLATIQFSSVLGTIQFSSVLVTIPPSYVCDKSNTTTIQHGVIHSTLKSCFVMSSRNTDDSYDCPDDVWRQRKLQQCHYWCLPPDKSANCKQLWVCLTHGTPSVVSIQPWRNTVHSKNMLQWNAVKTKNTVYSKPACLILNIGRWRYVEWRKVRWSVRSSTCSWLLQSEKGSRSEAENFSSTACCSQTASPPRWRGQTRIPSHCCSGSYLPEITQSHQGYRQRKHALQWQEVCTHHVIELERQWNWQRGNSTSVYTHTYTHIYIHRVIEK